MSIYNTTDKCRSFSGEIDTDNMPILKAEEVLNRRIYSAKIICKTHVFQFHRCLLCFPTFSHLLCSHTSGEICTVNKNSDAAWPPPPRDLLHLVEQIELSTDMIPFGHRPAPLLFVGALPI